MLKDISWTLWFLAFVLLQFAAVAIASFVSRSRFPHTGLRMPERLLLGSSLLLAAGFLMLLEPARLWRKSGARPSVAASFAPRISCASIAAGMTSAEVESKIGKPDRKVSEEETRGPGAQVFVYENSRCAVHLLDERVESVE